MLVGFVGILIVLRPMSGTVQWAMLLPLVTASCFALYQILTRIGSSAPWKKSVFRWLINR